MLSVKGTMSLIEQEIRKSIKMGKKEETKREEVGILIKMFTNYF